MKNLVITGPSGVGKGTIVKKLLEKYPNLFELSVSCTTRTIRPTETDGKEYYFITKEEFQKRIDNGEFLEHEEYVGNFYGTLKNEIPRINNLGKFVIFDIEPRGAISMKKQLGENVATVFILPESIEILEKQLRGRQTETEEKIEKRLKTAVEFELPLAEKMDFRIVNKFGGLENSILEIEKILGLN